ncbi:hypothetical protein DICVIV_06780 [Dictyocaulus viviparus]|uniref:Uncharacterized protein n=1 Tax=Dictyocaulus viviparus TaxID=29172 RepID=A0A0D8XTM8_DICVI|nr:hypothetical protein DICVIV_06780 [Dictyocaulus viviparus]
MTLGTIMENERSQNLMSLLHPTILHRNTSLQRTQTARTVMSEKLSKCIIEARCTDNILFTGAAAVGAVVLVLQSFPICMNNWVFLTEPRPINKTNENGEQIESTFHYNVGYFQVCRVHKNNQSGVFYSEYEISRAVTTSLFC